MKKFGNVLVLAVGLAALILSVAGCGDDVPEGCYIGNTNGVARCLCEDEDGDRTGDFPVTDSACNGLARTDCVVYDYAESGTCTIACDGSSTSWDCNDGDNNNTCDVVQSDGICTLNCPGSSTSWDCSGGNNDGEICGDGVDNDYDGSIDEGCGNNDGEICGDGIDNDYDGLVDEGCNGNPTGPWGVYAMALTSADPISNTNWQADRASQMASCYMNPSCRSQIDGGGNGTFQKIGGAIYNEEYPGFTGGYVVVMGGQCFGPINLQSTAGEPIFGTLMPSNQGALPFSTHGGLSISFDGGDECQPVVGVVLAVDAFSFNGGTSASWHTPDGYASRSDGSKSKAPYSVQNKISITPEIEAMLASLPIIELDGHRFMVLQTMNAGG